MTKRVKKMVELESKIREREIEMEKRNKEIEKREVKISRKEEEEKKLKERKEIEEREKREKVRLEEELKEQMAEQQAQMKRLLEEEVKMPQVFDGTSSKVSRFVEDCRKYTERMKGEEEDKICWIVSYVQGDRTDKWKEKIVDEMFKDRWKNQKVEDILKEIEKEFGKDKKVEEDIWKGLDSFGEKGMEGFWKAVKEKEEEKKETPIVVAMMPRVQTARRGGKSGFWKR